MSDDFFNSVPFSGQDSTNQGESVDSFAQAIAARFGSADLLTARLLPDDIRKDDHNQQIPQHHHPHLPKPSVSLPSPTFPLMLPPHTNQPHDLSPPRSEPHSIQPFCSIPPLALLPYLSDTSTLILDIRPHAAHVSARINRALSLSVPSTLLKRPLFSLSKLAQMLPSSSARSRFPTWPAASRILVYDADSAHLPHNSNIAGLLRKFRAEGFTGELGWVRGGFQAVWREARELTTTEQPSTEDEDAEPGSATSALRTKHLPKTAFSVSSTINLGAVLGPTEVSRVSQTFSQAANPFFDVIRQNVELSHGITERIPLRLPRRVRRRLNDLPFQWLREIARRSAIREPSPSSRIPGSESESSDEPHSSDPEEHDPGVEEGTEALAMQFYRIELAEQRRLQTIMEHHSKESEMAATGKAYYQTQGGKSSTARGDQGADDATGPAPMTKATPHAPHSSFPFSITAGVEKGTKNRYKYIWPFEHARVRLHDGRHQGSYPGMGNKGKPTDRGSNRTKDGIRQRSVSQLGSLAVTAEGIDATLERAPSLNQANSPAYFVDTDTRMLEFLTSPMDISPIATQLPGLLSSPSEGALPESTITRITPFPLRHPHSQVSGSMDASTHTGHSLPLTNAATLFGDNIGHSTSVDLQQGDNILPGAQRVSSPLDDYINASYVQPLGTRKKYIATQGPLPATFVDFWTLVWEQNVHVIVMLTREIENAMVKCGTYWTDASYGPFRLELLSTSPPVTPSATTNSTDANREGFFFALREPRTKNHGIKSTPTTITRRFALSHSSYPGVPPRCIIHLQYLDWPDMNVPDDPRGVLGLVKRVERAVAESSPGPSPSGSGGPSPGSSISPGSTSLACESRQLACNKHGRGWRHPELDPHTGVATFALGKSPPVLLHCSAGVGRTGGFIAVDAVLDGIRRELNETRRKGALFHAGADIHSEDDRRGDNETAASGIENMPTGNGDRDLVDGMDIDKPSSGDGQVESPGFMATAPLHVTAGDRKKSRKHQRTNRIGESSSSESLVLHVPIAMHSDGVKSLGATYMQLDDPKTTGWQNLSTRAWAERVSNQTNARAGTMNPSVALTAPMPISAPHLSSRARSPESASSSSPLSADDSVGGSTGGNTGGGDSNCNKGRKSESIGASGNGGGRAGVPPSTSVSSASRSISVSNSNSGTGSSSQFGSSPRVDATNFMSLMRSRLMESSATSLSNISADSLPWNKVQGPTPIRESSALRGSPFINACMDLDRPRAISVPLNRGDQPTLNGSVAQYTLYQCRAHRKSSLDSSLATRFSAPSLTDASVRGVPFTGGTGKGSYSNPSSDGFIGSGQDFGSSASAGFYSQWSNKGSQVAVDQSAGNIQPREVEDPMETNVASDNNGFTTDIPISCDTKDKTKAKTIGGPTPGMRSPTAARHRIADDSAELDPDNPVIDYKLPRPLHTEVLPPFLTSYQNPIWVVVQDMREQRMSLCQSLRQYVFVHAAVVEGALQIVDEERELWEDTSGSDEDPGFDFGASLGGEKVYEGDHDRKAWVRNATGVRGPTTTLPSSVVSSSPSKGKRGPSPTELLKEDWTGALSLAKRPSIKRKPPSEDGTLHTFEEEALPPPTESIENTTGPEIPSSSTILDTRRSIQNKKSR